MTRPYRFEHARDDMTPRELAEYIRGVIERWTDVELEAKTFVARVMEGDPPMPRRHWLKRWWVARHARRSAREARRYLYVFRRSKHFLDPELVRRILTNGEWKVWERDGELVVDTFVVSPIPPAALASVIDALYARRATGLEVSWSHE